LAAGGNLLDAMRGMGLYVPALCGGRGTCGKCRIRAMDGALDVTETDAAHISRGDLDAGWRLACAARPTSDAAVEVAPRGEDNFAVVEDYSGAIRGAAAITTLVAMEKSPRSVTDRVKMDGDVPLSMETLRGCSEIVENGASEVFVTRAGGRILRVGSRTDLFAIAADIGTTTLCMALVDVRDGAVLGRLSMINKQREYGADVISRIHRAANGDLAAIGDAVRVQLARGAQKICSDNGVDPGAVVRMAVVGNTAMLHLLLGLSCKTLGAYPFTPVTLDALYLRYDEIFEGSLRCAVEVLPGISTYVGADITAGILFTNLPESERPALLLDMGTNGEMAVSRDGRLCCTATAAGPAFEGGNIEWGTGSVPGAISSVRFDGGETRIETIGGTPPTGICGSGVIDAVAACLKSGIISGTGRFEKDFEGGVSLGLTERGREIRFTQRDVREVQLAKSAVRSGIDILLKIAGLSYGDVGAFYIAGGFGYRIGFDSGVAIGLFPEEFSGRMTAVGNSALGGAIKYLLDESAGGALEAIARGAEHFDLSEDGAFNDMFMENMMFP